jgi:hypothetical protein
MAPMGSGLYRAQADALVIEAQAKRRLADEYDAAQERGEVRRDGERSKALSKGNSLTVAELGLTSVQIARARELRDAEVADPGIVRRTVDEAIANREEPRQTRQTR